jgi:hypothetical protein
MPCCALQVHYRLAVHAERQFRFAPVKALLLKEGLASHWSVTHDHYATCVAYLYVPSPTKPRESLDATPHLWAREGQHPPLEEASRVPAQARGLARAREEKRLKRAEAAKPEPRVRDVDVWPVVVRENILAGPGSAERLMAWAKRCGGEAMVDYCFHNFPKLPDLISRSWQVENVEEQVKTLDRSRMETVTACLQRDCVSTSNSFPLARSCYSSRVLYAVLFNSFR